MFHKPALNEDGDGGKPGTAGKIVDPYLGKDGNDNFSYDNHSHL